MKDVIRLVTTMNWSEFPLGIKLRAVLQIPPQRPVLDSHVTSFLRVSAKMKVTLGNINQRNNRLVSYHFKLTCSPLTTYDFIMVITRGKFVLLKFLFSYNSTIFHWRVVRFSEVTYLEEWLSRIKENLFSERWSRSEISVLHTFQLQEQSARGLIFGHSIYQSCHFFHL